MQRIRFVRPTNGSLLPIYEGPTRTAKPFTTAKADDVALAKETFPLPEVRKMPKKIYGNMITDHLGLFRTIAHGNFRTKYGGEHLDADEFFGELLLKAQERWDQFDTERNKSRAAFIYSMARGVLSKMIRGNTNQDGMQFRKALHNFRAIREEIMRISYEIRNIQEDKLSWFCIKHGTSLAEFKEFYSTLEPKEIATIIVLRKYGITEECYHSVRNARKGELSIYMPKTNDDGEEVGTLGDTALTDRETPESQLANAQMNGIVKNAIEKAIEIVLSKRPNKERDRRIVENFLFVAEEDEKSLASIAADYGVTRERVRQVKDDILKRLKKAIDTELREHGGAEQVLALMRS